MRPLPEGTQHGIRLLSLYRQQITEAMSAQEFLAAIRELERIEDELAGVKGMAQFRERVTQVRVACAEYALTEEIDRE